MQLRFQPISDDCSTQELERLLRTGYLIQAVGDGTYKIPASVAERVLELGRFKLLPIRAHPWRCDHKALRLPCGSICTGRFLRRARGKWGWTSFATGETVTGSGFLRVYDRDGRVVSIITNVSSKIGTNLRKRLARAGIIFQGVTGARNAAFDTLTDDFYVAKRNGNYYVLFRAMLKGHGPLSRKQARALVRSLLIAGLVEDMGSIRL